MKTVFLVTSALIMASSAFATSIKIVGAHTCAHNSTYAWECSIKPDVDDKTKGKLKSQEIIYQWFIPGPALVGPKDNKELTKTGNSQVEFKTIFVDPFPGDPKNWPKCVMTCNVRLVWTKKGQEVPQSSVPLTITVTPQQTK